MNIEDIDIVAQQMATSIYKEKLNYLNEVFEEYLPQCSFLCNESCMRCYEHKFFTDYNIPTNSLTSEFQHRFCQGVLGYIPESIGYKITKDENLRGFKNLPKYQLCRLMLRLMAKDSISDKKNFLLQDVIVSIFAWSGGTSKLLVRQWRDWILNQKKLNELENIIKQVRSTGLTKSLWDKMSSSNFKGIGSSLASKILFFYDNRNALFILDRKVLKALNSLCNFEKKINKDYKYFIYNKLLLNLSKKLKCGNPELLEILLWNIGKRSKK